MSLISTLLFPAPPASYSMHSFPSELLWIPWGLDYSSGSNAGECVPAVFLRCPAARYLVLYLHSNGEDIGLCYPFGCGLRMVLEVHVLLVEYPGYGICPGPTNEESLWQCASAAFRFATEVLEWPAEDVIIMGRSLGAAVATRLAGTFQCQGLILLAPFTSLVDAVRTYMGALAPLLVPDTFCNKTYIARVKVPTLVIHGLKDRLVPPKQGEELYEICPCEKKLLVCPEDMGHNSDLLSCPDFLIRPMLQFFSLPDYAFVDPLVPPEAFNKRLCPQYHGLVEMTKDDSPLSQPQGDQEPCPTSTTTEGPQCFVGSLPRSFGDRDDLEGSPDYTVRTPRGGMGREQFRDRADSSLDPTWEGDPRNPGSFPRSPGGIPLFIDALTLGGVGAYGGSATTTAVPQAQVEVGVQQAPGDTGPSNSVGSQSTTVPSSPMRPSESTSGEEANRQREPTDGLQNGPGLPGLHILDIDNGITRFLHES